MNDSTITLGNLAEELCQKYDYVDEICRKLVEHKMISKKNNELFLTGDGRNQLVIVFTGGVFDIIHPGHLHTLSSAKKLGDVLVVSVARDKTVKKNKGRNPINNENIRLEMAGSLKYVDSSLLGSERDIYELVEKVKPNVICLGYDQKHNTDELNRELSNRGINAKIVRLGSPMPDIKSSRIMETKETLEEI